MKEKWKCHKKENKFSNNADAKRKHVGNPVQATVTSRQVHPGIYQVLTVPVPKEFNPDRQQKYSASTAQILSSATKLHSTNFPIQYTLVHLHLTLFSSCK